MDMWDKMDEQKKSKFAEIDVSKTSSNVDLYR